MIPPDPVRVFYRRLCLSIFVLLTCAAPVAAQTSSGIWLGLGVESLWTTNRDVAASPLLYRGRALPLGLHLTVNRPRSRHVGLLQGASTVTSNAGVLASATPQTIRSWDYAELGYAYERRISALSRRRFETWAGARTHTLVYTRTYSYLDGISWEWYTTLDARLGLAYMPDERSSVRLVFDLTLIGYANRPPYFLASERLFAYVYDGEGRFIGLGGVHGFPNLRKAALELEARIRLSRHLGLGANAGVYTHRFARPEPTTTLQRHLSLSLFYVFR